MPIENLKMFPNPNDGNFSTEFTVTEPSNVLINITDSKGSNIYEKEGFRITAKLPGHYYFDDMYHDALLLERSFTTRTCMA